MHAASQPLCPKCGDLLVVKKGINGAFLGCNAWPKCKHSVTLRETAAEAKLVATLASRRRSYAEHMMHDGDNGDEAWDDAMYDAFHHDVGDK